MTRVFIHINQARNLVDEHRHAVHALTAAGDALGPLVAQASTLLPHAVAQFHHELDWLAIDLANDADDLVWRIDYLESTDRSFDVGNRTMVNGMPTARPRFTMEADELAALLARVAAADDHMRSRDWATLSEGVNVWMKETNGDPDWDEAIEFWNTELDDPELAEDLHHLLRRLGRLDISLQEIGVAFEELEAAQADPWYLAEVFNELGPEGVLELTESISIVAWAEALDSRRDGPNLSADPAHLAAVLSESLGLASQATGPHGRHGRQIPLLSRSFFDDLFDAGVVERDMLWGPDRLILHDGLPALFATGDFRTDVAEQAGVLGMRVFDHEIIVERGVGSPLYDGFAELETHWEDRAGMLTGAAARDPRAAAVVLVHDFGNGRLGAHIVADGSFDNMQPGVVAPHYARLILAGTSGAEALALVDGRVADVDLLDEAWVAKTALFDAIAAHRGGVIYPEPLGQTFTLIVAETIPHIMTTGSQGPLDFFIQGEGFTVPSNQAGIHFPEEETKYLLGALFRTEANREILLQSIALAQREALVQDPNELLLLQRAGELHGATVNAFAVSGIMNARQQDAEIAAANSLIDQGWKAGEFTVELLPWGSKVTDGIGYIDDGLALLGEDSLEDTVTGALEQDANNVEAAEIAIEDQLFDVAPFAQQFVFDRAFDQMQAEFLAGGPDALSDTSRAIFERIMREPDIAEFFIPGQTTKADVTSAGERAAARYANAADELTTTLGSLSENLESFDQGVERSIPVLGAS